MTSNWDFDPLIHFQESCERYGIDLTKAELTRHRVDPNHEIDFPSFVDRSLRGKTVRNSEVIRSSLSCSVFVYIPGGDFNNNFKIEKAPQDVIDYVNGRSHLYESTGREFDILSPWSLNKYNVLHPNFGLSIHFEKAVSRSDVDGMFEDTIAFYEVVPKRNGGYTVKPRQLTYYRKGKGRQENVIRRQFPRNNPASCISKSLELYANSSDSQHQKLDEVVDTTISTLFTGEEREQLERKISEARLRMRKNWASIPRLNLGPIQLPSPGQKDVTQDQFVMEATPYVVEYLSALGVMEPTEAERVMAQKLTNYLIHEAGFQLSRDRANQIVDQLKQEKAEKREVA